MDRNRILESIKALLAHTMPQGASVFLFGSQARGDYSRGSDWDLLILLRKDGRLDLTERGSLSMPLYMLGGELGVEINPVMFTDQEWKQRSFTPFYKNVISDGIKIWG